MGFSPFGGADIMFTIVPIIVGIGFVVVFSIFIITAIQGAKQWKKNNDSPILSVLATVVTKRANTEHHHHHSDTTMDHVTTSTRYYVTFQVESGDRMELAVRDMEYGMLVEGDTGKLTFQGTRYKGFERQR